jgi:3-oxoacyl-[acyl-carrier protein] reductase
MEEISKKIAIVTGASRGLGKATALALAKEGYFVIGTATSENGASAITTALNEAGGTGTGEGYVLNIADKNTIETFFKKLDEKNLAPAILVNNAGITRDNLMLRMKDEEWEEVIETNMTSIFRMSKLCLKPMIKARWGRIINISSISGTVGLPGQANYSAAKAGVIGFGKALAKEIASRNITVNAIAPGFIESDMTNALSEERKEKILSEIPMGRIGKPEDIAAAVVFLASDAASYITGQTLHVNGGMLMV